MSAFQNIIDLRFAVSDLVGNRVLTDVFPRLVELAETDFNSRFRMRQQIADATLYVDDGITALPPDFMEIYAVDQRGRPWRYQVDGFNLVIPDWGGDLNIQYYARLPSLTCSPTATNWLLRRYPNVYLYGVALQAAIHLQDADMAVKMSSLYSEAVKLLRVDDERARWSSSSVRIQGPTP